MALHSLDLAPNIQAHVSAIGIVVNVVVAGTVQLTIQLWLEARFTLHCTGYHRDDDQLRAMLASDLHRRIDVDADGESGLERWEA